MLGGEVVHPNLGGSQYSHCAIHFKCTDHPQTHIHCDPIRISEVVRWGQWPGKGDLAAFLILQGWDLK